MMQMDKCDCVEPGEEVGTEEEFLRGFGTYIEKEKIRSLLLGEKKIEDRRISVDRPYKYRKIHRGAIVLGRVENVMENTALVSILPIDTKDGRYPKTNDYAGLHVSKVSEGYVKDLKDKMRIGDIIKAMIIEYDIKTGKIGLAMNRPFLGVVKAYCSKCRAPLKRGGDILTCERCGGEETRQISNDYRNVALSVGEV